MPTSFFEHPILNSPYESPSQHWELENGQPTEQIINNRRPVEFITPIPKPRKRKKSADQLDLILDEGWGLSTKDQQYEVTDRINKFRAEVEKRRQRSARTTGRSRRKPPACSSTGGTTASTTSVPFFARSKGSIPRLLRPHPPRLRTPRLRGMAEAFDIKALRQAAEQGRIHWNKHALERALERGISRAEVLNAMNKERSSKNMLATGLTPAGSFCISVKPLHVVAAVDPSSGTGHVITVYRPDPEHFESDFKTRRKQP